MPIVPFSKKAHIIINHNGMRAIKNVKKKSVQVLVLHRVTGPLRRRVPRPCCRALKDHRGEA